MANTKLLLALALAIISMASGMPNPLTVEYTEPLVEEVQEESPPVATERIDGSEFPYDTSSKDEEEEEEEGGGEGDGEGEEEQQEQKQEGDGGGDGGGGYEQLQDKDGYGLGEGAEEQPQEGREGGEDYSANQQGPDGEQQQGGGEDDGGQGPEYGYGDYSDYADQ